MNDVDSLVDNKGKRALEDKMSMRRLIFRRYSFQTVVVLIVFGTILFAAMKCLISKDVTGTLLGGAVTLALKVPFRSYKSQQNDDEKPKEGK